MTYILDNTHAHCTTYVSFLRGECDLCDLHTGHGRHSRQDRLLTSRLFLKVV